MVYLSINISHVAAANTIKIASASKGSALEVSVKRPLSQVSGVTKRSFYPCLFLPDSSLYFILGLTGMVTLSLLYIAQGWRLTPFYP